MTTKDDHALQSAEATAESIIAMVAALEVDYNRLEELQNEYDEIIERRDDISAAAVTRALALKELERWTEENGEEFNKLKDDAGEYTSRDDVEQTIHEDPLSVEVRSDWHIPGDEEGAKPSEFCILLTTGGPACRIVGELDEYLQPSRAWIEYQDWFTPWTQLFNKIEQDTLLTYCQQFFFGD